MESKFCPHCGAGVNPNSGLLCGACGKQVEKTNPSAAHVKAPGNKKPLIIGVAVVVVILAVILGVIVFSHPKYAVIGKWIDGYEHEYEFSRKGSVIITDSYGVDIGRYSFDDKNYITIKGTEWLSSSSSKPERYEIEIQGDKMTLKNRHGDDLILSRIK